MLILQLFSIQGIRMFIITLLKNSFYFVVWSGIRKGNGE